MAIQLPKETERRAIASIQQYFAETLDDGIGDLKASMLLQFFLEEIAPSVYNQAIADAQAHLQERVSDIEGSCFEAEFAYWRR